MAEVLSVIVSVVFMRNATRRLWCLLKMGTHCDTLINIKIEVADDAPPREAH